MGGKSAAQRTMIGILQFEFLERRFLDSAFAIALEWGSTDRHVVEFASECVCLYFMCLAHGQTKNGAIVCLSVSSSTLN